MRAVAEIFGKTELRGVTEGQIVSSAQRIRTAVGDRAILRALHFVRENERVDKVKDALRLGDVYTFLDTVKASGGSSFMYLQNVYTSKKPDEQGLSLALALADGYLQDKRGAFRVHGGGFAGTVQVFVKHEDAIGLKTLVDGVFGTGAVMILSIRPVGACKLF
jgi:galactokinase